MMRCEAIHDWEIFPNRGPDHADHDLACAGGHAFLPGRFFGHTYEQKMCDYLIYLEMTGSIKFTVRKNFRQHSQRSQT
jgi:hypothetical protein